MDILQIFSASKYASHKPLASVSLSLSFCLSLLPSRESHFSHLTFNSLPFPFSFIHYSFFDPSIFILFRSQPQCPTLVSTYLCWLYYPISPPPPPFQSTLKVISSHLPVSQWGKTERDRQTERKKMRWGQETWRYDWSGETTWRQKFICKNSLLPHAFLICIQSLFLLFSPPASCLLNSLPRFLFLSVSLHSYLPAFSLSFCVSYHPALLHLHCGAALTIRTLHTYTEAHTLTDSCTHRETHAHHFRQPPPPPSLTPLHCRHETLYNPWCASALNQEKMLASKQYSAFKHNMALDPIIIVIILIIIILIIIIITWKWRELE